MFDIFNHFSIYIQASLTQSDIVVTSSSFPRTIDILILSVLSGQAHSLVGNELAAHRVNSCGDSNADDDS